MRFALPATFMAVLAFALPPVAGAQTVPNLTGTWVMRADQSNFGVVQAPKNRTDVIDHQEPKLSIKRTVVTPEDQQNVTEMVCAIYGKPCTNSAGPMVLTSVLRWDGSTLVMATTAPTPQGEVTFTDRFTLSADGNTLTQARTLTVGAEQTTQTIVLAKQP